MSAGRGYLLPDGDAYTDELECAIVFFPNKDEYRRALLGSLDYLSKWLAWERDDDKRGKDAARAWREANELTLECIEMSTCQQIVDLLTEIRDNQCSCSGGLTTYTTYYNNLIVTTTIVPWEGTAPSTWGGEAIADWDEWAEYVCGAAHQYVDDLIETVDRFKVIGLAGGYTLDFLAHLYGLLNWRYVLDVIPVNWDLIFSIIDAVGEALLSVPWDTVKSDIESARSDIVCALVLGTDLSAAVQDAIDNTVLWDWFFSHLDYDTTAAVIYAGEVPDVGYLTPIQRGDCYCDDPYQCDIILDCSFESHSYDYWIPYNGAGLVWDADAYHGAYSVKMDFGAGGAEYLAQEFTAPATGYMDIWWHAKKITGIYAAKLQFDHWNGSSWVDLGELSGGVQTTWTQFYTYFPIVQGDLYRLKLYGGGYHLVDNIIMRVQ